MSVRVRRSVMGLAGLFWVITSSLVGVLAAVGGSWSHRTDLGLLGGADLAAHIAAVLSVAAVLGYVLGPLAVSHGIGVRAAFRAGRDMPPPMPAPMPAPHGRHARELATDPYENVTWLRPLTPPA